MHPIPALATLLGVAALSFSFSGAPVCAPTPQDPQPGYTDTPRLPDGWRVHDAERPRPSVLAPGQTVGAPPADAVVLFDGSDLRQWRSGQDDAKWNIVDETMVVAAGSGDLRTRDAFGDCQLHIEWSAPLPVQGHSQGRGNSGVFFFERYEVQVLDSFDNPSYADGQAAALYGQKPPLVNVTRAPGEWNIYDIAFIAPRFGDDGTLRSPARVTVLHNGVIVQLDEELLGPTAHRSEPKYSAHGPSGPIKLQDHGNAMRFRNIWIRPLDLTRPAAAGK